MFISFGHNFIVVKQQLVWDQKPSDALSAQEHTVLFSGWMDFYLCEQKTRSCYSSNEKARNSEEKHSTENRPRGPRYKC